MKGQEIAGRYIVQDELGSGGMGTVYRGLDKHTQQTVAIKLLKPEMVRPEIVERFQREGEALRELNHPNMVKMLDALEEDGHHYLVMEYVAGGDLKSLLQRGQLSIERCLQIAIELVDALTRAHYLNIIHRDLKPANILIASDGTARLTDFGIARLVNRERITDSDAIMGTIDYLAPEAFSDDGIDYRADIWALGVMLFEMLTGDVPFKADNIMQRIMVISTEPTPDLEALRSDVPIDLVDLIYRMLEKDPQVRIISMRHVGASLEDIMQSRSLHTPPETRFATPIPKHFEPLKHNLPVQTTAFVGRETELSQIKHLIDDPQSRLITILASGGMGKTRLALAFAESQIGQFADGVYFVGLAPFSDPNNIIQAIANVMNYQFQSDGRDAKQQVLDSLASKNMLLIMDNFEHLLGAAVLMTDILNAAPDVQIVVTSRQRLNQSSEVIFYLGGMDFADWQSPDEALDYAVVKLFMQSARRVQPQFEISADNMRHVARICQLTEGIPLGILLAASWLAMLSVEEIADEIAQGLDFLESEMSDFPERHRSMRAVFDYSWDLMSDAERDVFMKLSVFRGGFTREAAQLVADANLRTLLSLMNKSLIRRDTSSGRYEIHELLRQYGEGQLGNQKDAIQEKHSDYFLGVMEKRDADIKGRNQWKAIADITTDFNNIQLAWQWACANSNYAGISKAMDCLFWYCQYSSHLRSGEELFHAAQDIIADKPITEEHQARIACCVPIYHMRIVALQVSSQDIVKILDEFYARINAAQAIAEKYQIHRGIGLCLWWRFNLNVRAGVVDESNATASRELFQSIDDRFYMSYLLYQEAFSIKFTIIFDKLYESMRLKRELHDEVGLNWVLDDLIKFVLLLGRWDEARQLIDESYTICLKFARPTVGLVTTTYLKGLLALFHGEFNTARHLADECSTFTRDLQSHESETETMSLKAILNNFEGNYLLGKQQAERAYQTATYREHFVLSEFALCLAASGLNDDDELRHWLLDLLVKMPLDNEIIIKLLSLTFVAKIYHERDKSAQAVMLLSLMYHYDKHLHPLLARWELYDTLQQDLQSSLHNEEYKQAWEDGKSLDIKSVLQDVLDDLREDS